MAKYNLYVYTNNNYVNKAYAPAVKNKLSFRVTKKDPLDQLSKRFKEYTHIIQYPANEKYRPTDYALFIYDPNAHWYNYILKYYSPGIQVTSVELYFKFNDGGNRVPLIIGINQKDKDPVYYTYNFVSKYTTGFFTYTPMSNSLIGRNMFLKCDLMSRLLEEYNMIINRDNRSCITIDLDIELTENIPITYPNTGFNKNNITALKLSYDDSFYKHRHKINKKLTFEGFYVLFKKNSLYIINDGYYRFKSLEGVEVYYAKSNKGTPVFIILNFNNISSKSFKYTDLIFYFKNSKSFIKTTLLSTWDVNNFTDQLKIENDQIDDKVRYMIEYKTEYSYKVKVEQAQDKSNLSVFTKYTHTPEKDYTGKNTLVLYNGERLMEKKNNKLEPIEEVQNVVYKNVTVYFGKRDPNIPLIIKFTKFESEYLYYSYKNENEREYWEKWEISEDLSNRNISQLINKLKGEEANLSTSTFILIDMQKDYKSEEIETTTGFKPTVDQPDTISVIEKRNCQTLEKSHYKCYEHHLKLLDDSITNFLYTSHIILKLLIPNNTSNSKKYSQLILYNGVTKVMEYINYVKGQNILYVFFRDDDPRPHSVFYGNKDFSPYSLDSYCYIWNFEPNINSFTCDSFDKDKALLNKLREVTYIINPVRLEEVTERGVKNKEYETHEYISGNKTIKIGTNVTAEDLNCYRKYTYTSNNHIMGEISHGNSKLFTNFNDFISSIDKYNTFPISVNLYHYMYDYKHSYPLLVGLEFRNGIGVNRIGKEYYELWDKEDLKWKKIDKIYKLNDQSELEKKLKEIKERLKIQYERKPQNLIIETASNCKEDSNVGVVSGTFGILGLAGVGIGLVYYNFPEFFKKLYRRVVSLIPVSSCYRK